MPSHKGIVNAESYLPPANITIRSLGEHYLCDGVRSVCWACECADHCEYGRIYCRMLRERVKAQKKGWRGYELAAAPLIAAQERNDRAKSRKQTQRWMRRRNEVRKDLRQEE